MIKDSKIPKLSLALAGYLILSFVIALFSYGVLETTSYALATKLATEGWLGKKLILDNNVFAAMELACLIGATFSFFTIFLYLIGQKLSYILELHTAIEHLEGGNLKYRIPIRGDDELSQLAESLNHLALTLEESLANEAKLQNEQNQLIRTLSHDIRTPLTTIISYCDFIQTNRYEDTETLVTYAQTIQNKAFQIKQLTDILLTSSPKDTSTFYNGEVLMNQLLTEYKEVLEDEGFEVSNMVPNTRSFEISISPQDLQRIFDNLTSNIIRYALPQSKISLEWFLDTNALVLYQCNLITSSPSKGIESHGIGLSSINQLVSYYKGKLTIRKFNEVYEVKIIFPISSEFFRIS